MVVPLVRACACVVVWGSFSLSLSAIAVSGESGSVAVAQSSALKLLTQGFESRLVPVEELERLYQTQRESLSADSPYLEYAFALVLSRNLEPKQAGIHLQAAAQSRSPILLAAHEELIRRAIGASDYQGALEMLAEYACLIGELPSGNGDAAEAHRAAKWLGCIAAYLEGPADTPDEMKTLSKLTGNQLKLLLDQRFVKDYEASRQAVKELHAGIERQLNEATTLSDSKKLDDRQVIQDRKEQVEQRATELKEASLSTQKTMQEQLSDVDSKIKMLEKQFALSLETEQRLMGAQILLQAEINRLKAESQQARQGRLLQTLPNNRNGFERITIDDQIARAEVQYAFSINQHALLLHSRFELTENAKRLIQVRQALAQKAGINASQAQSQLELMKRWEARLEGQEKKHDKASTTDSSSVARIRRRMSDLATYDNGTLEQRREIFANLLQQATMADGK